MSLFVVHFSTPIEPEIAESLAATQHGPTSLVSFWAATPNALKAHIRALDPQVRFTVRALTN